VYPAGPGDYFTVLHPWRSPRADMAAAASPPLPTVCCSNCLISGRKGKSAIRILSFWISAQAPRCVINLRDWAVIIILSGGSQARAVVKSPCATPPNETPQRAVSSHWFPAHAVSGFDTESPQFFDIRCDLSGDTGWYTAGTYTSVFEQLEQNLVETVSSANGKSWAGMWGHNQ
jgi:hypothetical protein